MPDQANDELKPKWLYGRPISQILSGRPAAIVADVFADIAKSKGVPFYRSSLNEPTIRVGYGPRVKLEDVAWGHLPMEGIISAMESMLDEWELND